MFSVFLAELKLYRRDWWFWLMQAVQPAMVVASIAFLFNNQDLSLQANKVLNDALLWVMSLWLQLSAMNLIWKNDFPIHAWQLSRYRLSAHASIRLLAFFLVFSLPAILLLFVILYGFEFSKELFLQFLLVQIICLQFSCILGFLLKLSNKLSGLGALFLMPIFLPLNLFPAGAHIINLPELIQFSILLILGIGFLGSVVFIIFFDGVLETTI